MYIRLRNNEEIVIETDKNVMRVFTDNFGHVTTTKTKR